MPAIQVQQAVTPRDLRAFVEFPWRVYQGDPNWVPPLISDQVAYLDPLKGPFYRNADVVLFLAFRGREVVGTIAAFLEHGLAAERKPGQGGFGFFEVIDDYATVERLLDAACDWLRVRGATLIRGPTNFSNNERPGVLIAGADCPPVMMAAHTPPYYVDLLERYGMIKDHDLYAYRAFRSQIGEGLSKLPPELDRVADVARRVAKAEIRKFRLADWEHEMATACYLFNETLKHLPGRIPVSDAEFARLANQFRPFLDPDLALVAEVDGQPVGFCVALPDINRVLIRLKGRMSVLNAIMIRRYIRQVKVVTFKMMGVLDIYRRRGIDALLYLAMIKAVYEKGYEWLDGSVTSEDNRGVNLSAQRWGAERYKHYRVYRMSLDGAPKKEQV
jgi:GNAT superfamily N-acetyltransferase